MIRLLAFVLLLGASACASDPEPAMPPASTAAPVPEADRPATRTDSFMVEGMAEPIDLRLVEVTDVPLPFSTYIPTDWEDEINASGEGTAVQFTMGEAMMSLFVPAHATTEAEVTDLARAVADSRGGAEAYDAGAPWRAAFSFAEGDAVGNVRVGEHDGTFFYVVEAHPIEYGDGFAPRVRLVLDNLRWADGSAL